MLTSWGDKLGVACEEQVIACQFICQIIEKYQEEKGSKHRALRHPSFDGTFAWLVVAEFYSKRFVV